MASTVPQKSRVWIWVVVAAALSLGLYLYLHLSSSVVVVRTAKVERQDLVSTISTNGKVEPTQDFQAHAPGASIVSKLLVKVGDTVRTGEELIRLDAADAANRVAATQAALDAGDLALQNLQRGGTQQEILANRSDLVTAEAQAQAAASNLSTLEALQAKGDASAAEVATARQRVADTAARVASIKDLSSHRYTPQDIQAQKAAISADQAAVEAAHSAYAGVDIHAPFAGTVYSVSVKQYEFVHSPEESLLSLADLTHLQVRAYFDEPEIGKLATGQQVKIVWDAKPTRTWHGHIVLAPATVETYGTRNVGECLISVDDADGELLPNTNVTVTVTTSQRNNVLSLPREALHTVGLRDFVYRIVDGHLDQTTVAVGAVNLNRVEITSGLNGGDTVALGATTDVQLSNGLRVKPQPAGAQP